MLVSGNLLGGRATYPDRRNLAVREGWPDAHAVETTELHENDGVTKLTVRLAFRDQAGRDHMTRSDGQEHSFNKLDDYLRSLVEQTQTAPG